MLDWEWLIGDAVIGALLPEAYASYRRPIVEGLRLFLSRLPGPDVARILGATPAVAGTILDLDRVAIPDSGETPGSIRARALAAAGEVFLART